MIIRTKSSGSPSPHQGRSRLSPPQIHHQTQAWLPRLESHPGSQLRGSTLAGPPESALKTFWRDTDTGQPQEEERYQYTPDLMTGSRGSHLTLLEGRGTSRSQELQNFMGEGSKFYHRMRKIKRMGTRMEEQVVGVSPKPLEGKRKPRSQKSSSATYRCLASLRAKEQEGQHCDQAL